MIRSLYLSVLMLLVCASSLADNKLPPVSIGEAVKAEQKQLSIRDSFISYRELGEGAPVVFLHGNPTSSYLWRNVMPVVAASGYRTLAPDLIGMGDSGKINSDYHYKTHFNYLKRFLHAISDEPIVLVVHDWGAALGFDYAQRYPHKVKAIAFMEGLLPPVFPQASFEAMGEEMGGMFRAFKDPEQGVQLVIENHMFVEQVLPNFVNRDLTETEMNAYRAPYINKADRKPVLAWPRAVPIAGEPKQTVKVLNGIQAYMEKSDTPMLLIYAEPGVLVNEQVRSWYKATIANLETAYVGQGFHFIQEDQPLAIGRAIEDWLRRLR